MNALMPLPASLPTPDNFPAYVRAVSQLPEISAEQERELALRWHEHHDAQAAKTLVLTHLRLVLKAVRDHEGYGLSQADLAQEGTVGLMKAVHKFNPHQGVRLATYAWYWIEAEIREFILKNWRLVSWGTSTLAKKLFFGYRKTVQALRQWGDERTIPSASDIASAMDVSEEDAQMARAYFQGADVSLFDEHDQDPDDATPTHQPLVRLQDDLTPFEAAQDQEQARQWSQTQTALALLPERTRDIVQARYLADPPVTLTVLAKKWGVSIERVRQIEQDAIRQLQHQLQPLPPAQRLTHQPNA